MLPMRAAIYARFSTDMQRATSIDDQIAVAHRYAAERGWQVRQEHTFYDAAVSGASLDRPGIQALIAAAARRPLAFDVLLVDDSSRVSRDLADAVRFAQDLKFYGVRVIFISQSIDTANEQAETLIAVHGLVDGLYLREMAAKIKRGLAGQLERGFATGSTTFGYRTVGVPDPGGRIDANGPVLLGKRVEIEPSEARIVVEIFESYAGGLGIGRIVARLNGADYLGPRSARWKDGAVKRVLANEKYTGKLIWGKKTFERRPGTRQHVQRPIPRKQWHVHERPELRIVSDELWNRVQARRAEVRGTLPASTDRTLMRGRNAALHSPYLFSGFLKCATCGGALAITTGGHGSPRYGCLRAWRNGSTACANRLTIRAKVVDACLLERLQGALLEPATVAYVTEALSAALNSRVDDRDRLLTDAHAAREQAAQRLAHLVRAIENGAPSAALNGPIADRQAELARLDTTLADLEEQPDTTARRLAVMPSLVREQLADLAGLLSGTPERTKLEFRRLDLRVEMASVTDEHPRPFYRATVAAALPELAGVSDLRRATTGPLALRGVRSAFAPFAEQTEPGATVGRLNLRAVP